MGTAVLNMRHGLVCESQNFTTRSNTSGQYPKVSIGILVDKTPSLQHEVRKKEIVPSHAYQEALASQENVSRESGKKLHTDKKLEPGPKKEAVWVSTRPIHHGNPSVIRREERTEKFFDGLKYDANGAKAEGLKEGERAHKESGGFTCGINGAKTVDLKEGEEVATPAQDVHLLDKGKLSENTETISKLHKDSLRLKLWEILGSGFSPTKQMNNSQILREEKSTPATEKKDDPQNLKVTSCKQNSDTIETDSENPNETRRRPITRSLRRKQAPQKSFPNFKQNGDAKKQVSSSACGFKGQSTNKNVFTFDEKTGTVDGLNRHGWSTLSRLRTGKRSNRNISRIEPRRISFPKSSAPDNIPESTKNEQTQSPIDVTAIKNVIDVMHHSSDKTKVSALHQSNEYSTEKSQNSETGQKTSPSVENNEDANDNVSFSRMKVGTFTHERTQSFADNGKKSKNLGSSPFSSSSQSPDILPSPTLNIASASTKEVSQSPDILPSPTLNIASASTKEVPREQVRFGPVQNEKIFYTTKTPVSINSPSSLSGSSGSNVDSKTSNEKGYTKSPHGETPMTKEESSDNHLSQSQSCSGCDNSEENEASNQGLRAMKWFADCGYKKIPISHSRSKKLRRIEDMDVRNVTTSSGTEETMQFLEVPEQPTEDGLARAISQFALILDQFKDKIRSYKRKKNSEILSAFGDRIHLQLQNVESQIQADVGRFTSLAKLKRKRLESTFQEHQENLKVIHEKFNEEIKKHLDDCRGTLEELETFQTELKTNAERQRTSHRNLLVQVEEAVKLQINDAETSIATIQEVTRRKMNGLKHALREWLNDGPLF